MTLHASDPTGDWKPVRTRDEMLLPPEAVSRLVLYALKLLHGEWWENPNLGIRILEMFRDQRLTPTTLQSIVNEITRYISDVEGVLSVEDPSATIENRRVSFSCRILTQGGSQEIRYVFG